MDVKSADEVPEVVKNMLNPGDRGLTQGAGSITALAHDLSGLDLTGVKA